MRLLVFILLVFACEITLAQREETLYYYVINDSLVGVKNKKGKIIIPAAHRSNHDINTGDTIPSGLINFFEYPDKTNQRAGWKTYDRNGKFLFQPYTYEFEPDFLLEGLSRFKENGKIGFADRQGKKIIAAQFDYVNWFSLGVASFCTGCYFDPSNDPEHPSLKGGTWGLVNRKGEILINNLPFDNVDLERILDSSLQTFYNKEFQYNSFEKKLISMFDEYKGGIEKEYFKNSSTREPRALKFDIVEKPSAFFPYYIISSREVSNSIVGGHFWESLHFYISKDGKYIYFVGYRDLVPFSKWYSKYSKGESLYD